MDDIWERPNDCWNRQLTLWKDGNLQSVTPKLSNNTFKDAHSKPIKQLLDS
jgi:hypothetical protein